MAAPGSGIKFLGLDSALVDLAEKKSTLSNNKQEYFTASDIANGITAFDNGIVINETGADSDTRIEGQADANLFFADASTDSVGIGTNTPVRKFHVDSAGANNVARVENSGSTASFVEFKDSATITNPYLGSQGDAISVFAGGNRNMYSIGSITVVNIDNNNHDFRIEGQTDTNLFFTDASTDRVGVGTNTPSYKLDVNGDVNVASGSAYYHNGTAGLSGTYTFGGGTTGDIATMTFNGGILTAVTTVP